MQHESMKYILLLLVWGAAAVSAAVPSAEKILPADTLAFLTVPDWSKAGTNFASSAVGQFWADPAMKAFKDKFLEKFNTDTIQPLEKELGFKFADYLGLAEGQFTLAVTQNGWDGKSAFEVLLPCRNFASSGCWLFAFWHFFP